MDKNNKELECWSNSRLINELSKKNEFKKEFSFFEEEFIDNTLRVSNLGSLKELKIKKFIDLQPI